MIVKMKCNWSCDRPVIEIFKDSDSGPVRVGEGFTANFLAYWILANGGPGPEITGFVPESHEDLWSSTCDLL